MILSGTLLYLGMLGPALVEADRKSAEREAFLPDGPQYGGCTFAYWFLVVANFLTWIPATFLCLFSFSTGPACGFGGLMLFFAPSAAFFLAITRRPAQSQNHAVRVLWRLGVFVGVMAVMLGFAFAACSAQPFVFKS